MILFSISVKDGDIAVKSDAADVVDKADVRRTGYLHGACLTAKLQNDGADLGPTRCTDGMAFGKEPAIDVHRDFPFFIRRLFANELLPVTCRGESQAPRTP